MKHIDWTNQNLTDSLTYPTVLHFHSLQLPHLPSSFPNSCPRNFLHSRLKMPINRDPSTPPPVIGKIGPYTVFMTPPATPKPPESPSAVSQKPIVQPPVLPPPQQFKSAASSEQDGSVLGFFKNAVTKVQNGTEREKSEDEGFSFRILIFEIAFFF